eukprot:scaffold112826_cov23-Tisochrysis_lutea.AAC.2
MSCATVGNGTCSPFPVQQFNKQLPSWHHIKSMTLDLTGECLNGTFPSTQLHQVLMHPFPHTSKPCLPSGLSTGANHNHDLLIASSCGLWALTCGSTSCAPQAASTMISRM